MSAPDATYVDVGFCGVEWAATPPCRADRTGHHICVLEPGHTGRCMCTCAFRGKRGPQ